MKLLGPEALKAFQAAGMDIKYKQMENGEERYGVMMPWGSFTVTIAARDGGVWQQAHYHTYPESYEVVQGAMAVALVMDDYLPHLPASNDIFLYRAGQLITIPAGRAHNVCLFPNSVIHTTAVTPVPRWIADPELDAWSKEFDTVEKVFAEGQDKVLSG